MKWYWKSGLYCIDNKISWQVLRSFSKQCSLHIYHSTFKSKKCGCKQKGCIKNWKKYFDKTKNDYILLQRSMITSIYDNKYHIKVEKWENRYIRHLMNDHQFQIPRWFSMDTWFEKISLPSTLFSCKKPTDEFRIGGTATNSLELPSFPCHLSRSEVPLL